MLVYLLILSGISLKSQISGDMRPLASWSFDTIMENRVAGLPANRLDTVFGFKRLQEGVQGKCLKLDGYTTSVQRSAEEAPPLKDELTIESWIALQALPWNWSAIINQGFENAESPVNLYDTIHRFFLGVDARGRVGFSLFLEGEQHFCITGEELPLLQWNHVAATFSSTKGMKIYINGILEASMEVKGKELAEGGSTLVIGRNIHKLGAEGSEREASAELGSPMVIEGLLDELAIYDKELSAESIYRQFSSIAIEKDPPLEWQKLPTGPDALHPAFDGVYTRLNYTDGWEAMRRVSRHPDILVRFDRSPVRLLFWRGTGYGAVWVTENGIWMGDQSLERANAGKSPMGCSEHMSDKQTRYSHVRIIEKNDARIVIHWRYALADILYDIFGITEDNPSGEWADEYYYIYPDGVAVREQILWTDFLSHEWQETIVINQAGTYPRDNIEFNAMTLLNMQGEKHSYSWKGGGPESFIHSRGANIQMVNLKSRYKPFIVFEANPKIRPVNPDAVNPVSGHFSWWNHWPVAQLPNDGRKAFGPDRPSHTSLSQSVERSEVIHRKENGSYEVITLTGMTDKKADSLVPLARSWNHPPLLIPEDDNIKSTYSKKERAYLIRQHKREDYDLKFNIQASVQSPMVHPVFVIENWGDSEPVIFVNGEQLMPGGGFRRGLRTTLKGTDLVLWTSLCSEKKTAFRIHRSTNDQ